MAVVDMANVPSPGTTFSRGFRRVSPRIYYAISGTAIAGGAQETWISTGEPDLRASTHTAPRILGQWYLS